MIVFGALVMLGSSATVAVPKLVAWWALGNVDQQKNTIPDQVLAKDIKGAINFLLLGTDEREGQLEEGARADSIMLVHIPATHDRVFMISFPRDLHVTIPPFPEVGMTDSWDTKINAAFSMGARPAGPGGSVWSRPTDLSAEGRSRGAALTMLTISDLVADTGGLKFNGWATVDFKGFEDVVNALGGVYMCVDTDVYSIHYWADGTWTGNPLHEDYGGRYGTGYHYVKGWCGDMAPWQALDYSRQRYELPHGDIDRNRHQQQLM